MISHIAEVRLVRLFQLFRLNYKVLNISKYTGHMIIRIYISQKLLEQFKSKIDKQYRFTINNYKIILWHVIDVQTPKENFNAKKIKYTSAYLTRKLYN